MRRKIRKGTQLTLLNPKRAGRKSIHDSGIRHICRPLIRKPSALHLTIKVLRNKADIKNKQILIYLKRAILRARKQGLRILHFTLEWDHVHLLIEADNNLELGKGMKAFGVTFAKGINRIKKTFGSVYKHRYHFRKINNPKEYKNVLNYIFTNGVKHKTSNFIVNCFNSLEAEKNYHHFIKRKIQLNYKLMCILDEESIFQLETS